MFCIKCNIDKSIIDFKRNMIKSWCVGWYYSKMYLYDLKVGVKYLGWSWNGNYVKSNY